MTELTRPGRLHVVVAHPDDETFGCGALLLHARAVGLQTHVTCATRGEAGEAHDGVRGAELGRVREAELRRAASVLGVSGVDVLGFADSGMSGPVAPGSLVGVDQDQLVARIAVSMRRVRPDMVLTLDASDGHRDHVAVRDATIRAATRVGVPVVHLACLSQDLMRRWVAVERSRGAEREHVASDDVVLGTPDEDVTTLVDVREHRAALERAMDEHASQDSPYAGLPADLRDAFLDTARARRVLPAWDGVVEHSLLDALVAGAVS